MLAAKLEAPEFILDPPTANRMAIAIGAVQELYPVNVSAKAVAWTNLAMTLGAVYGPRVMLMKHRKQQARAKKDGAPMPDNVVSFASANAPNVSN